MHRGLDILFCLLDSNAPLAVGEVATATGLHKATVSRVLSQLAEGGFAAKDPTSGRYLPGPKLVARLRTSSFENVLRTIARGYLVRLRDESGESVALHVAIWPDRICIDAVESNSSLRRVYRVGERWPLTAGATGCAYLAYVSEEEVARTMQARPLQRFTPQTDVSLDHMQSAMAATRRNGFAISGSQTVTGMAGVAVPVLDETSRPIAMITISGPEGRLTEATLTEWGRKLRSTASQISRAIYNAGDPPEVAGAWLGG